MLKICVMRICESHYLTTPYLRSPFSEQWTQQSVSLLSTHCTNAITVRSIPHAQSKAKFFLRKQVQAIRDKRPDNAPSACAREKSRPLQSRSHKPNSGPSPVLSIPTKTIQGGNKHALQDRNSRHAGSAYPCTQCSSPSSAQALSTRV